MTPTHPSNTPILKSVLVLIALALASELAAGVVRPADALRALIYDPQWSMLFHLAVFFLIFLGITVRPLKERLDRGGVIVAIGFASLLSTSLVLSGRFNLLDFEPIAATGIFVLLGVVVASAFKRLYDASWPTTAAVGFICGYGALRVAAPSLMPITWDILAAAELGFALAIVWLLYSFISTIITEEAAHWPAHAVYTLSGRSPKARERFSRNIAAQRELAARARHETEEHATIAAGLDETIRTVKASAAGNGQLRSQVAKRVKALGQALHNAREELERYKALSTRVEALDAEEYAEVKEQLEDLPPEAQAEARNELRALRAKLNVDAVQERLENAIEANNAAAEDALQAAQTELAASRTKAALHALNDAKRAEAEALRLAAQVQRFASQFKAAADKVVAERTAGMANS